MHSEAAQNTLVVGSSEMSAKDCFALMAKHQISAVPVVGKSSGVLVATLSASDLRGIDRNKVNRRERELAAVLLVCRCCVQMKLLDLNVLDYLASRALPQKQVHFLRWLTTTK